MKLLYHYGCSVLGAILIVAGLYSVLWGKYKEHAEKKQEEEIPEAIKAGQENGMSMIDDIETNDIEMQKAEAKKLSSLAISIPIPEPPMKANQDSKA